MAVALLTAAAAVPAHAQEGPRAPDAPPLFRPAARAPLPDPPKFVDVNGGAPTARDQAKPLFDPSTRAAAAYRHPLAKRVAAATAYARARSGRVAFAVIDLDGRLRGWHVDEQHRSASVVKAMFLVAYLNRIRGRALSTSDRRLLGPMIVRSDNDRASRVYGILGPGAVYALARRARMTRFVLKARWGDTLITAADQARYFARIDLLVPERHRAYARKLLASIIEEQRWGVPPAIPSGWRVFFKGGWRPLGRRNLVNQSALIESGDRRVALAVLTDGNPSHVYGTETIRGVARRVLRGLR
ncbi:MAG TPA: serine hydrolase [Thermoleophilaceae bacterium]